MDYYFPNRTWPKKLKKKKRFSGKIKFHGSMFESSQDEDGSSIKSFVITTENKIQRQNNHFPIKNSRLQNVTQHNDQASYSDMDDRDLFYFDLSGHRSPSIGRDSAKSENNVKMNLFHQNLDDVINIANNYNEKLEKNKTRQKRKYNDSLNDSNTLEFDDSSPKKKEKKKCDKIINDNVETSMDFSDIIEIVENINVENIKKENDNQIVKKSKKNKTKSIKAEPTEYLEVESSEMINNYYEQNNLPLNIEQCTSNTTKELTKTTQKNNQTSDNFVGSSIDNGISNPVFDNTKTMITNKYLENLDSDGEYDFLVRNIREKSFKKTGDDPYNDVIASLESLEVIVPFEIPTLHRIVSRPSKPSNQEFDIIKQAEIPMKTGRFTKDEDDKIITNWNNFLEFHELDVAPTALFSLPQFWSLENRLNFLRFIAHGLDDRLLHRVHTRFKLIFNKSNTQFGRFSKAEDRLILNYASKFKRSQRPFAKLSKMLNRDNKLIIKRYDMLTAFEKFERIKWSIENESELVNVLMAVTKCDDVKFLESVVITDRMWREVSEKMNMPISKLKILWRVKTHPRLFASDDVDLNEVKGIIVKRIYKSGVNDIKLVDWKPISRECYNLNGYKLYQMLMYLVHKYVPKEIHNDLRGSLKYLRKMLHQEGISTAHKFPKYVYENGKLQVKARTKKEG